MTQDGIAKPLKRDQRGTVILRTAMRTSLRHTPSIRSLMAVFAPGNDNWHPLAVS